MYDNDKALRSPPALAGGFKLLRRQLAGGYFSIISVGVLVCIFIWLGERMTPGARRKLRTKDVSCFVCITGQQSRLLEGNKTTLFFEPLAKHCGSIDVAFVLSDSSFFINAPLMENVASAQDSYTHVIERIRPFCRECNVRTPKIPTYTPHNAWERRLSTMLYKGRNKSYKAATHYNQVMTIASCSANINRRYDISVRIREDSVFEKEVPFEDLLHHMQSNTVYFQKFDSWGGINDKIAVTNVQPQQFFKSQLRFWNAINKNPRDLPARVTNFEQYTASAFIWSGFKLQPTDFFMGTPRSPWNGYVCNQYGCKWRAEKTWLEHEWSYVCITGQLGRLELASKIEKFIQPLTEKTDVIVKLALTQGESHFTNSFDLGPGTDGDRSSARMSIKDAREILHKHGVKQTIVTVPFLNASMPVHTEYIHALDKKQWLREDPTYNIRRERNHKRQYETLDSCKIQKRDGFVYKNEPRYTFRVREDTFFVHADIDNVLHQLDQATIQGTKLETRPKHQRYTLYPPLTMGNIVYTQKCASWFGINDKFAALPGHTSNIYFETPLKAFKSGKIVSDFSKWGMNPENFYMNSYKSNLILLQYISDVMVTTCGYMQSDYCTPRGHAECEKIALQQLGFM